MAVLNEPVERQLVALGIGLARRSVFRSHDVLDAVCDLEVLETELNLVAQRAGYHEHRSESGALPNQRSGPRKALQLTHGACQVEWAFLANQLFDELWSCGSARIFEDGREPFAIVEADVAIPIVSIRDLNTQRPERVAEGLEVNRLVVDENSVVVEEGGCEGHRSLSCSQKPLPRVRGRRDGLPHTTSRPSCC